MPIIPLAIHLVDEASGVSGGGADARLQVRGRRDAREVSAQMGPMIDGLPAGDGAGQLDGDESCEQSDGGEWGK